jgi:exo-beta-1,3-glucanase (GH17 family)
MVSIALKSPDAAEMSAFASQFARIADYVDVVGASAYPYAFYSPEDGASPDSLPADWLSQISAIAPGKPVAITETGWVAQDLVLPRFGIDVNSDDATQQSYVERMLNEAQRLDVGFVIWFTIVDFDALWNGVLGQYDLPAIWRDTGLYDETQRPRDALDTWQAWLGRPVAKE